MLLILENINTMEFQGIFNYDLFNIIWFFFKQAWYKLHKKCKYEYQFRRQYSSWHTNLGTLYRTDIVWKVAMCLHTMSVVNIQDGGWGH